MPHPRATDSSADRRDRLYLLQQEIRGIQKKARIAGQMIAQEIEAVTQSQTEEVTDNERERSRK